MCIVRGGVVYKRNSVLCFLLMHRFVNINMEVYICKWVSVIETVSSWTCITQIYETMWEFWNFWLCKMGYVPLFWNVQWILALASIFLWTFFSKGEKVNMKMCEYANLYQCKSICELAYINMQNCLSLCDLKWLGDKDSSMRVFYYRRLEYLFFQC